MIFGYLSKENECYQNTVRYPLKPLGSFFSSSLGTKLDAQNQFEDLKLNTKSQQLIRSYENYLLQP